MYIRNKQIEMKDRYAILNKYNESLQSFDRKKDAIEACKNNPDATYVEDSKTLDNVYEK